MDYAKSYRSLFRIRRVEEEIVRVYPTDKIKSPVHMSIGQEAVAVGVCQALRPDDVVFGTYRGHALYLAKGGDLKAMIAELFQTSVPNINIHLKNIYEEGELDETATVKEYLIVRREGTRQVSRKMLHYSLDAILAVGYRVKSPVATLFRQWATARLSEYLVKGFTLNDERLKGTGGLTDYFDELLARIRILKERILEPLDWVCPISKKR